MDEFASECLDLITECEFTSRWALIEGYHSLGLRLIDKSDEELQRLAPQLHKRFRTLQNCREFAKKYPDLNLLPEGKHMNWYRICNKYLRKED